MQFLPVWGTGNWLFRLGIGSRPSPAQLSKNSAQHCARSSIFKLKKMHLLKRRENATSTKTALIDPRKRWRRFRAFWFASCEVFLQRGSSHCASNSYTRVGRWYKGRYSAAALNRWRKRISIIKDRGTQPLAFWMDKSSRGKKLDGKLPTDHLSVLQMAEGEYEIDLKTQWRL